MTPPDSRSLLLAAVRSRRVQRKTDTRPPRHIHGSAKLRRCRCHGGGSTSAEPVVRSKRLYCGKHLDQRKLVRFSLTGFGTESQQKSHRQLILLYIFLQIPATEAGLQATRMLQKEGINVNLYLVGSFIHAAACAETGAAAVTIHVGRVCVTHTARWKIKLLTGPQCVVAVNLVGGELVQILGWFERQKPSMAYHRNLAGHPGVETIQTIIAYFRLHKIKTRLIGTQFRKVSE